jgi:Flp pilus assembly protein TadB
LDSTIDVAIMDSLPGIASIPGMFDAPAVSPTPSTQARVAALISNPRVRPYLGIAVAAVIWMVGGRGGLAVAFLALWYAGRALLRARERNRVSLEQERCALHAITTASRALRAGIPIAGMMQILANEGEGDAGKAF